MTGETVYARCVFFSIVFEQSAVFFTIPIRPAVYETSANIDKEEFARSRLFLATLEYFCVFSLSRKGRSSQMDRASQRATCAAPVSMPSIGSPWQHSSHARCPHGESPFSRRPREAAATRPDGNLYSRVARAGRRRVIYVICIKNSSANRGTQKN